MQPSGRQDGVGAGHDLSQSPTGTEPKQQQGSITMAVAARCAHECREVPDSPQDRNQCIARRRLHSSEWLVQEAAPTMFLAQRVGRQYGPPKQPCQVRLVRPDAEHRQRDCRREPEKQLPGRTTASQRYRSWSAASEQRPDYERSCRRPSGGHVITKKVSTASHGAGRGLRTGQPCSQPACLCGDASIAETVSHGVS